MEEIFIFYDDVCGVKYKCGLWWLIENLELFVKIVNIYEFFSGLVVLLKIFRIVCVNNS